MFWKERLTGEERRVDLSRSSFALVFNSGLAAQKQKLIESGNHFLSSELSHALSSQWVTLLAWEKRTEISNS